jgi:hypothetical protein
MTAAGNCPIGETGRLASPSVGGRADDRLSLSRLRIGVCSALDVAGRFDDEFCGRPNAMLLGMGLIPNNMSGSDRTALARVRAWARELWRLGGEDSVVVTELACSEPGCPPLETVVLIAAVDRPTVQHKLHLPAADVRLEDLQALVDQEPSV